MVTSDGTSVKIHEHIYIDVHALYIIGIIKSYAIICVLERVWISKFA